MWGLYLDSKAFEDGLFHAVVQYKIDNSKAACTSPICLWGKGFALQPS